jgi:hypothetical protein
LLKKDSRLLDEEGFWLKGELLKGKELLKGNCQRGTAKEGLIELVGSLQGNGLVDCLQV